jgi:hypothetical protein
MLSAASTWRWATGLLAVSVIACRTREDGARKTGRAAAVIAVRECTGDAGVSEGCRASVCARQCSSFADSVALSEACATRCLGQGTCDSDLDCDRGLICRMIAPRLRRCQAPGDADAGLL